MVGQLVDPVLSYGPPEHAAAKTDLAALHLAVGGGVGGLFCAAKLAREGKAVTLIEKNPRANAGGRLECETVKASNGRSYRFEVRRLTPEP